MSSEAAINHAGCQSTQPFRDLRSASRAKQRTRKHLERYNHFRGLTRADLPSHPSQKSHYLPVCGVRDCPTRNTHDGHWLSVFPADLSTAPTAKFAKHEAYEEAQWSRPVVKHHSYTKPDSNKWRARRYWKKDAIEEIRSQDFREDLWWEWYQDLCRCYEYEESHLGRLLRERPELIRSWDAWTEVGETFSQWGQRRINEMRAVKEARLRAKLQTSPTTRTTSTSSAKEVDSDEDEGYHSSTSTDSNPSSSPIPTTTQPTDPYDIQGHDLIKKVLTVNPRRQKWVKFSTVEGFYWFGEFEWYWHRNWSGCWYVTEHPCITWSPCFCNQFRDLVWWDPEDVQRYDLSWWMDDETWDRLIMEEEDKADTEGSDGDEWDIISISAASDAWSEVGFVDEI